MPIEPSLSAIQDAKQLLASYFPPTRLIEAPFLASGGSAFLKLESDLPTASFKPRGALYALATTLKCRAITEVTASSTSNHGAAVAWAAKTLGIRATIFLPSNPNPTKRKRIADLGARIIESGGQDLAHAFLEAQHYSSHPNIYFLNDATDAHLPAGPATIGLELFAQLPDLTAIYVPIGDTALIRGVGAALRHLKPAVKIIGVQAERAPSYYLSWKSGHPAPTNTCDTIADGLATRTPEPGNVEKIRELVDEMILVTEEEMLDAVRVLHTRANLIAEPAGAAATAAYLKTFPASAATSRPSLAVILLTGANITDLTRLRAGLPTG